MARPIIGITGELEAARWGNWIREAVVSPVSYTRAVQRAGGTPVVLPPVPAASVAGLVAALDGLVLTGGRDVDPALYDEQPHEQTEAADFRRDRFELAIVRAAIDIDLPFLAIGRGLHVLNVARGGSLTQHLPDRVGNESHRPDPVKLATHEVTLSAASRTGRALGAGAAKVPAGHHQAVNRIGSGLLTVAWTEDQVVEALELQGHAFGVAVQWHPEEADDLHLFEALIAAAAKAAAEAGSRRRDPLAGPSTERPGVERSSTEPPAAHQPGAQQPGAQQPGQSAIQRSESAQPAAASRQPGQTQPPPAEAAGDASRAAQKRKPRHSATRR
ncbi:MAG TPA: gamma-glutamyl-gamma-aminobutyrate hydrolase family protein [Streptosporangiaceae bacterium]|nr:gamma-glutamyl-gamma-aminobutyrate hydrolase family protein [Streptosporangiaceae bacterium]